jgi:hypothetical protein
MRRLTISACGDLARSFRNPPPIFAVRFAEIGARSRQGEKPIADLTELLAEGFPVQLERAGRAAGVDAATAIGGLIGGDSSQRLHGLVADAGQRLGVDKVLLVVLESLRARSRQRDGDRSRRVREII